jgi:formylglycine-generating enzyme required for sulfatase activity
VLLAGPFAAGEQSTAPAEETPEVAPRHVPFRIYTAWPFDAKEAVRRQKETARALGLPAAKAVDLGGGVKIELVLIPAGEFLMGAAISPEETLRRGGGAGFPGPLAYTHSHPQHRVRLTKPFYMCKYEVTQDVWEKVMGTKWERPTQTRPYRDGKRRPMRPADYKGERRPVDRVDLWQSNKDDRNHCQGFLKKLDALVKGTGTFRLPTEAQWEYACRAGTATPFYFGEHINADQANVRGDYSVWDGKKGVARQKTVEVGSLPPNAWGLHEMHGNVWEWCEDLYGDYPKNANTQTDPSGPAKGDRRAKRVLRGGAFCHLMVESRSAYRRLVGGGYEPNPADVGFRLVLTVPLKTAPLPEK